MGLSKNMHGNHFRRMPIFIKEVYSEKAQQYIMEQYDNIAKLINIVVAAANTIAGNAIIDTKNELYKRKDLWHHEIKFNVVRAVNSYYEYENVQSYYFDKKKNLFLDYLSAIEENIAKDVQILNLSFLQVLTKNNQSDRYIKAQVETAYVLTRYACSVFDKIMEEARARTGYDYTPYFIKARLTSTLHYWEKVAMLIMKTDKETEYINFNDDPNCRLAFNIIERKLTSEELPNRAGYEALKQNIDLVGTEIKPEDYDELKELFDKSEQ